PGPREGMRPGMGFGGGTGPNLNMVLSPFMADRLELSEEQRRELQTLQEETQKKMMSILNEEQRKQLEEMSQRRPGPRGAGPEARDDCTNPRKGCPRRAGVAQRPGASRSPCEHGQARRASSEPRLWRSRSGYLWASGRPAWFCSFFR